MLSAASRFALRRVATASTFTSTAAFRTTQPIFVRGFASVSSPCVFCCPNMLLNVCIHGYQLHSCIHT